MPTALRLRWHPQHGCSHGGGRSRGGSFDPYQKVTLPLYLIAHITMAASDTPIGKATMATHGSDDFWVEKWSNNDTPWRALERDVGAPVFPQPMFKVRFRSSRRAVHLTAWPRTLTDFSSTPNCRGLTAHAVQTFAGSVFSSRCAATRLL